MIEDQPNIPVTPDTLVTKVCEMRYGGHRLVQIGATPLKDVVELNYSFDRDGHFTNLRLQVPAATARVPSVSGVYWCAFIYENELHDLFKIQVDGIAVDFKGEFYKMAVRFPFANALPAPPDPSTAASTNAAPAVSASPAPQAAKPAQ